MKGVYEKIRIMLHADQTNEYDRCIICGSETEYRKDTPVCRREHYIESCGQVCRKCHQNVADVSFLFCPVYSHISGK